MEYPQTLFLKDQVQTVTVEDTEEGHEGRIMPLEVSNDIRHIIVASEDRVDK